MTSPGREFDPSRKYKVILSERLKNEDAAEKYINSIVHIDSNLKVPSRVKSAQIKTAPDDAEDVSLHLSGPRPGETYIYGGEHSANRTLVLLFDQSTQTFTLDSLDAEYSFMHEEAVPSDVSASDSEVGTPLGAIQTTSGEGGFAGADEDAADPDNPYDWRNHLRRRSKSSSSPNPDHLDPLSLDAGGASPSPEPLRQRKAPAPAPAKKAAAPLKARPKPANTASSRATASTATKSAPAPKTASRPAPKPAAARRRQSTPPSDDLLEIDLGTGPSAPASPSPEPVRMDVDEPERATARRAGREPEPQDVSSDGDDDSGGLEIVEDGANEPRRGRGRFAHRRVLAGLGEGPRSLRASRSPAAGPEDFGGTRRGADGDSDGDVDAIQLGSPMHEQQAQAPAAAKDDEDEEMMDADGLEAEFERALEQDDDDNDAGRAAPGGAYLGESSSESEEE